MAEKKTTESKPAAKKTTQTAPEKKPAAKKGPTAAELKAAAAQLEEQETGKKKNTVLLRVAAFVLWALAAVAMYLPQIGEWNLPFGAVRMLFMNRTVETIVDIVVAAVLCVIAARLWVAANHIHPTKSHSPVVQFLWNQLGVIMAGVIFAPLAIILIVKSDKIDEKTKKLVAAVLAVVFVAASAASADYHPVTQDAVDAVLAEVGDYGITADSEVYFTTYGYKHHYFADCQAIRNSNNVESGSLQEAVETHHSDVCAFCARRAAAGEFRQDAADALTDLADGAEDALEDLDLEDLEAVDDAA